MGCKKVYIVGGLRTPIGKTNKALKNYLPENMTATLLKALVQKNRLPKEGIEELILGNSVGPGGNLARLSLLEAGFPINIPGTTIDFQCGSGLKSINLAASLISSGQNDLLIAGGAESTSLEPRKQYHNRDYRFEGDGIFYKRAQFSPYSIGDPDMIQGAENTAKHCKITREALDLWAVKSHERAKEAYEKQYLKNIIVPLEEKGRLIEKDESIRKNASTKLFNRVPPIMNDGVITPGNACLTHDGAALLLLASEEGLKRYNLKPLARWVDSENVGINPNLSPLGPVYAVKELLKKNNLSINDIDIIELNEAFAVKVRAFLKEFDYSEQKINPLGGALAYGHPYGASGAIILIHLLKGMELYDCKKGIATLGVAGGQGIATLIERC